VKLNTRKRESKGAEEEEEYRERRSVFNEAL
jgi:hypothetical protein